MSGQTPHPADELLPPPAVLRSRLAQALRDVDILRRLLRLSESVARRDVGEVDNHQSQMALNHGQQEAVRG